MGENTNTALLDLLSALTARIDTLDRAINGFAGDTGSLSAVMTLMQQDLHHVFVRLDRLDCRIDKIESRLELRAMAEPQHVFYHDLLKKV